ncbi:MAG: hypothetical protein AB7P23_08740 [Amphiplicatus sp.]
MRYLVDTAVFVVTFVLALSMFESAANALIAGIIVATSVEALQGNRRAGRS